MVAPPSQEMAVAIGRQLVFSQKKKEKEKKKKRNVNFN